MAASIVTVQEFLRHGPGPAVWEPLGRRVVEVDLALNRFRLPSHGLLDGDPVTLLPGPAAGGLGDDGALPAGFSAFQTYYAIRDSSALFGLSATIGGARIDLTDTGDAHLVIQVDMEPAILQALQWESDRYRACAKANAWGEPVDGWAGDVKNRICDLAAWPLLDSRGYKSPEGERDGYMVRWQEAVAWFKRNCETAVPAGAVVEEPELPVDPNAYLGSSGWGEEARGFGRRENHYDYRRPVVG